MNDAIEISHFFSTMPVASFFSDFLDKKNISIKLPNDVKVENAAYVKAINATFGIRTSFSNRLGLYTLFLNHSKLQNLIEIMLSITGNGSDMNYNDIVIALNQLKKSSESIVGGGKPKPILQFIMMLSILIGNIYVLKCMMNSFSYKYENSVAYQTMSIITSDNCKAPKSINPLIDYTFQSITESNLLSDTEKMAISGLLNTYKCIINPENIKAIQYDESEELQSYMKQSSTSSNLTFPPPPKQSSTSNLALPPPPSSQIAVLPSFEKWNEANSVQLFSDKILTKFKDRKSVV
jgi:hypothetical protein